jgi:hypothetical protein
MTDKAKKIVRDLLAYSLYPETHPDKIREQMAREYNIENPDKIHPDKIRNRQLETIVAQLYNDGLEDLTHKVVFMLINYGATLEEIIETVDIWDSTSGSEYVELCWKTITEFKSDPDAFERKYGTK